MSVGSDLCQYSIDGLLKGIVKRLCTNSKVSARRQDYNNLTIYNFSRQDFSITKLLLISSIKVKK